MSIDVKIKTRTVINIEDIDETVSLDMHKHILDLEISDDEIDMNQTAVYNSYTISINSLCSGQTSISLNKLTTKYIDFVVDNYKDFVLYKIIKDVDRYIIRFYCVDATQHEKIKKVLISAKLKLT